MIPKKCYGGGGVGKQKMTIVTQTQFRHLDTSKRNGHRASQQKHSEYSDTYVPRIARKFLLKNENRLENPLSFSNHVSSVNLSEDDFFMHPLGNVCKSWFTFSCK